MAERSQKEKAVLAVVGVLALYALAAGVWFFHSERAWSRAKKAYARECAKFDGEEKLIAEKAKWNARYEEEKAAMPTFDLTTATDTTWLRKVEELARTNLVLITQIDHGEEIAAGDVLELPIEVKSYEASLEALVKFMYALENTDEGMFDVRALNAAPSRRPGYLKGSMSITCAYMRGK